MSDTYEALLLAILANPEDDSPRLILADWLDENGQPERAEFVRIQCELANRDHAKNCRQGDCDTAGYRPCAYCRETRDLWRRERELWGSYPDENDVRSQVHAEMPPGVEWCLLPESLGRNLDPPFGEVRRGFIYSVRCKLADWLAHGAAIVRRQPVERVEVTDVRPYHGGGYSEGRTWLGWCEAGSDHGRDTVGLPAEIYRLLPHGRPSIPGGGHNFLWYATEQDALDALRDALLTHARRRAFPCGICETTGARTVNVGWRYDSPCPACGGQGWKIGR